MNTQPNRLKHNNFDFLRLLFAFIVVFAHAQILTGMEELKSITQFLSAEIAVKGFFVISGFLIFMSYEKSKDIKSYAIKRFRRIYPAYFTIVILCAFGLSIISTAPLKDYFSYDLLKYLLSNLTFMNFMHHDLFDVFNNNPLTAVNGALWTLKIEVMFYISVPIIIFLCNKTKKIPFLIFLYLLSVLYSYLCAEMERKTGSALWLKLGRQLPAQLSFFIAGGLIYYLKDRFEKHIALLISITLLYFISRFFIGELKLIEPIALGITVCFFALFLYIGKFGKYGDFSYGVYIIHFPIIQIFVNFGLLKNNPYLFLFTITCLTLFLGIIMWHLIEKRFLLRSNHYVEETEIAKKGSPL